jgi:hypothetical protein
MRQRIKEKAIKISNCRLIFGLFNPFHDGNEMSQLETVVLSVLDYLWFEFSGSSFPQHNSTVKSVLGVQSAQILCSWKYADTRGVFKHKETRWKWLTTLFHQPMLRSIEWKNDF